MSNKIFTKEEIKILSNNKYVKHVSEKGLTYTKEFKEYFVDEYYKGKLPTQIFNEVGLYREILGSKRIQSSTSRFLACFKRDDGFEDTRKGSSGRPRTKGISLEEQLKIANEKIEYLKQENEFLKKINRVERKAKKNNQ